MGLTRTKENRYNKKYDDKEIWDHAMGMGAAFTVRKLCAWHIEQKGFGTLMGCVFAMWRHAARNPELCFPQYRQWYFENAIGQTQWVFGENGKMEKKEVNSNTTFTNFLLDIQRHIKSDKKSIFGKKTYKDWCARYGLAE